MYLYSVWHMEHYAQWVHAKLPNGMWQFEIGKQKVGLGYRQILQEAHGFAVETQKFHFTKLLTSKTPKEPF